jgi:hypothetical protein
VFIANVGFNGGDQALIMMQREKMIVVLLAAICATASLPNGVTGTDELSTDTNNLEAASRPATMPTRQAMGRTLQYVLYTVLILAGIFVVSSYAFLRWSRRYKRWLLRSPSKPTPHEDVWQMHKLPPELTEDEQPDSDDAKDQ